MYPNLLRSTSELVLHKRWNLEGPRLMYIVFKTCDNPIRYKTAGKSDNKALLVKKGQLRIFTARCLFIIVCHLQTCALEPTLDIETLVGLTAIQNTLVAPYFFCHVIQRLYDS